jgi:hypothetical protein
MLFRRALVGGMLAVALGMGGCSHSERPPLGKVSGKITLDGKPLEGVIVNFSPDQGRRGSGTTDNTGYYEIVYRYGVAGSKVGPTTVSFEWPLGSDKAKPLAEKYTTKSTTKVDVKPGRNTFDFKLESDPNAKPRPTQTVD